MKPVLTRAEAVADELRHLIRSNEFAPGTPLRQTDIAERLGVSTTPVREAFKALGREGLVRHDPHRGVVVFQPSPEDLRENYEIRLVLEPLGAEIAAREVTPEGLTALQEVLGQMREAVAAGDVALYASVLNPQFHALIYDAANRPRLADIIATLRDAARAYALALAGKQSSEDLGVVQREHEAILAALAERDTKAAAKAMRLHLSHNAEAMMKLVLDGAADGELNPKI